MYLLCYHTHSRGFIMFHCLQTKLQSALLNLGQFQSAVDELLSWLERTERMLSEGQLVRGDPRLIEIELAKHRVG